MNLEREEVKNYITMPRQKRHPVLIALGSNQQAAIRMAEAADRLMSLLSNVECSRAIHTLPMGIDSPPFLNSLVRGYTQLSAEELEKELKTMEHQLGRTDEDKQRGIIAIDADLLRYDDRRFHEKDWERPYIKELINEFKE